MNIDAKCEKITLNVKKWRLSKCVKHFDSKCVKIDAICHCTAPVMWGNVRPWATMLGSNVLWFEACIFMILTLDGKIFREKVR